MSERLNKNNTGEILVAETAMYADIPLMTPAEVINIGQRIRELRTELNLDNYSQYCKQIINLAHDQNSENSSNLGELRGLINYLTTSHWMVVKEVIEAQYSDYPEDLRSDFFQIGMIGLLTAALKYDPEREGDASDPFRPYAKECVSGILTNHFDDLTNPVGITRHYASWVKRYVELDEMLKKGEISHDINIPFLPLWLSWLSDPNRQGVRGVISISTEDLESLIYEGEQILWDEKNGKPTILGEEIIKKFYLIMAAQNAMSADPLSSGFDEREYEELDFFHVERSGGNPRVYEDWLNNDEVWLITKTVLNQELYEVFYLSEFYGFTTDEVAKQLNLSSNKVFKRLSIAHLRLRVWLEHDRTNNQ